MIETFEMMTAAVSSSPALGLKIKPFGKSGWNY